MKITRNDDYESQAPGILLAAFYAFTCLAQGTPEPAKPNPFVGTSKENVEKRNFIAKQVVTYERQGDKIKYSHNLAPEDSYSFTLDGKEVPYRFGAVGTTLAWKAIDDHTCERRINRDGKIGISELSLSPDGKTLTDTTSQTKPNGEDSLGGKDNPLTGPTARPGPTISSKRLDDHSIEKQ